MLLFGVDLVKIPVISMSFPNSITSDQNKVNIFVFDFIDLGLADHHLFIAGPVFFHLELEVTQRSGHPQLTVDPVIFYLASCGFDSEFFLRHVRLMLNRNASTLSTARDHAPGVSQTGNVNCFSRH